MSSAEWFLPNFGIPNFYLSTFKERKRYQHAAELEKKVYTSTGGTGGGHSSEERLLTLFIIDFYVRLRLFSSAVETVLAWRWQVHSVLGFKCICRDEEVRRRTVLVVTSIICVCPCSEWCCYRNSAWWKCPTVQFTKESPLEVLISWEGVVIACWNVALNWSIGSCYRPVDFCRGAAIVSEFEWAESVEVTLLTTVELQRQLYFCRCSHRVEVASPTLKHSDQLSKDRVSDYQCCQGRIWLVFEARQQDANTKVLNVSNQFQLKFQ